jgi:ribonuclease BN (tRNA processing enzyme)
MRESPALEEFVKLAERVRDSMERVKKLEEGKPEMAMDVDVGGEVSGGAAVTECPFEEVIVTTLGTGACIPTRMRNGEFNYLKWFLLLLFFIFTFPAQADHHVFILIMTVSCTHIDIPHYGGLLLDAGEGTYGQMYRKFGGHSNLDKLGDTDASDSNSFDFYGRTLDSILMNLRVIFISHMHADHHLGVFQLLRERFRVFQRLGKEPTKIYIIGPYKYEIWLNEYSEVEEGFWGRSKDGDRLVVFVNASHMRKANGANYLGPGLVAKVGDWKVPEDVMKG